MFDGMGAGLTLSFYAPPSRASLKIKNRTWGLAPISVEPETPMSLLLGWLKDLRWWYRITPGVQDLLCRCRLVYWFFWRAARAGGGSCQIIPEIPCCQTYRISKVGNLPNRVNLWVMYGMCRCIVARHPLRFNFARPIGFHVRRIASDWKTFISWPSLNYTYYTYYTLNHNK